MIKIISSNEHHKFEYDWLTTYHHFSFGEYQNPEKINFGPLRVFNDDTIQPGKGFDFHFHRDMEIVTYVLEGTLQHKDNLGNEGIIEAGEIQRMTAGTGVKHSEFNNSSEKPVKLLQMWIFPNKKNLKPSWEQIKFSKADRANKLLQVIAAENTPLNSIPTIHQDVSFFVSRLEEEKDVKHELNNRQAYSFIINGKIQLNGKIMETKDAAMIQNEKTLSFLAEKSSELILIDLPTKFVQNQ